MHKKNVSHVITSLVGHDDFTNGLAPCNQRLELWMNNENRSSFRKFFYNLIGRTIFSLEKMSVHCFWLDVRFEKLSYGCSHIFQDGPKIDEWHLWVRKVNLQMPYPGSVIRTCRKFIHIEFRLALPALSHIHHMRWSGFWLRVFTMLPNTYAIFYVLHSIIPVSHHLRSSFRLFIFL